jgi:hypothetical protein
MNMICIWELTQILKAIINGITLAWKEQKSVKYINFKYQISLKNRVYIKMEWNHMCILKRNFKYMVLDGPNKEIL